MWEGRGWLDGTISPHFAAGFMQGLREMERSNGEWVSRPRIPERCFPHASVPALYYGVKEGLPFARISRQTMGLPGSCSERQ